jgi:hypothetical protein
MSDASNAMTQALASAQEKKADKAAPKAKKVHPDAKKAADARQRTQAVSAPTLADVQRLVPNEDQMANIVKAFGVETGDVDELTGVGLSLIREQYEALAPVLVSTVRGEPNYQGIKLHLDRLVDGAVRSAYGAANFYENRRTIAKDAADSFANESRDEDRLGIDGGENRVAMLRRIAAENGAKAYALATVAAGACAAYEEVMGTPWKPYSRDAARNLSEQVAAAQAAALGF